MDSAVIRFYSWECIWSLVYRESLKKAQSEVPPEAHRLTPIRYCNGIPHDARRVLGIPEYVGRAVNATPFYVEDLFRSSWESYRAKLGKTIH